MIYIGPNVLHQPINLSDSEPAVAIVARNDPDEQEHVIRPNLKRPEVAGTPPLAS
jgi:uncharacterized RmlC-like cupin family protein